jgi:ribonuclease Z
LKALRVSGTSNIYLFDCGEGTQIQIQRSTLRASRITKIHGDHLFGLPGLLCTLSGSKLTAPVILYGPLGLREFIETTLRLSHSWLSFKYEIVELIPNPYDGVDENSIKKPIEQPENGRTVNIDPDGRYHLISDEDNCSVYAVSIKHRVPTYG